MVLLLTLLCISTVGSSVVAEATAGITLHNGSDTQVVGVIWYPYPWTPTDDTPDGFMTSWCKGVYGDVVGTIPIRVSFCVRNSDGYEWNHGDWIACNRDCGSSDFEFGPTSSVLATLCCKRGWSGNPMPCFLAASAGVKANPLVYPPQKLPLKPKP